VKALALDRADEVPEDALQRAVIRRAVQLVGNLRAEAALATVEVEHATTRLPTDRADALRAFMAAEAAHRLADELEVFVVRLEEASAEAGR